MILVLAALTALSFQSPSALYTLGLRLELPPKATPDSVAWFGVALETTAPEILWRRGQTFAVTLHDGRRLQAIDVLAMTERAHIPLGRSTGMLKVGGLLQRRSQVMGRVAKVLVIALPDPALRRADIAALHLVGGSP